MSGWIRASLLVVLALPVFAEIENPSPPLPAVLVIFSNDRLLPANVVLDAAFRSTLQADGGGEVEIFSEFLGAPRFTGEASEAGFAVYLKSRYEERKPAVVVTMSFPALDFMIRHRDLFPDARLVAGACTRAELESRASEAIFAGVPFDLAFGETVKTALKLHPDRKRLLVISGAAAQDQAWEKLARRQLDADAPGADVEFLSGLTIAELERRLTGPAGDGAIALFVSVLMDGDGKSQYPVEVVTRLATIADMPIYAGFDTLVGTGVVGGEVISFGRIGTDAAMVVSRMMGGETEASIGITTPTRSVLVLDDRQVRRWRIKRERIPADAEIRFAAVSPWNSYRREILIAFGLIGVQALLIVVLILEQRRRKRAEKHASAEARKLRLITNSLPALIAQIDANGRFVFANEAYRQWWHVDPSSIPGRTVEQVIGSEVYSGIRTYVARALAGERVHYVAETRLADGSTRDIEALYVPDIDSEGNVNGYYSLVLDVTEEKRVERENLVLQSELAHASRMSTMGELTAALAHELNQPLTAIMSNAQAAERFMDRAEPDLDEVRSILQDIVADDRRASEVIARLREFLKKGTLQITLLSLNEVAREVVRFLGSAARRENVTVALDLDESIPSVRGDRIQLQQVVLNLVANAIDAMSGSTDDRVLRVRTTYAGGSEVALSVSDSGPGIDPSMLRKVFEPFLTTKAQGMGLGLSLCRTLVEAHGGTIDARNEDGGGAVVEFRLPAALADE